MYSKNYSSLIHALFDKYLDHMLVKFEQNCMVGTTQNVELFDKELTKHDTDLEERSLYAME